MGESDKNWEGGDEHDQNTMYKVLKELARFLFLDMLGWKSGSVGERA